MHRQQALQIGLGRLAPLPAQPVATAELRLDGAQAVGSLRVAPTGVVLERGGVAEEEPLRDRVTVTTPVAEPILPSSQRVDVAVVGAGAAGLYAALVAAREGASVVLVSRSPLAQTASYWAQGGIAAALAADDSPELHAEDTIAAGRRSARESAVRVLCDESPERVPELGRLGVRFDADRHGALALGLEGGHSRRRVVHAGGAATGRRITRQLSALAATHERVQVLEPAAAGALLTADGHCAGLVALTGEGERLPVLARATILATGGMAALWERSTNPPGAVGAGLSLAAAAGADLADLELMQFHPTALAAGGPGDGFLITEAVRGEGATLLNADGERFVDELAPRDEVALAVEAELSRTGRPAVGLDMRSIDLGRFPNIAARLAELGIDPARETVPVAPAAHYTMGGVATGLDCRSTLPGLYAVGECACNGLHGANRLASNSLAECFVFGRRAALAALDEPRVAVQSPAASRQSPGTAQVPSTPPPSTRAALWRFAGLRRDRTGLEQLVRDPFPLANVIGAACLLREESRGAHQRSDHPDADPALDGMHTLVRPDEAPRFERWE
jgi:L-aspartate oxidase